MIFAFVALIKNICLDLFFFPIIADLFETHVFLHVKIRNTIKHEKWRGKEEEKGRSCEGIVMEGGGERRGTVKDVLFSFDA